MGRGYPGSSRPVLDDGPEAEEADEQAPTYRHGPAAGEPEGEAAHAAAQLDQPADQVANRRRLVLLGLVDRRLRRGIRIGHASRIRRWRRYLKAWPRRRSYAPR